MPTPVSMISMVKLWWSASVLTRTLPCSLLYLTAFSIRLVRAMVILVSSTSATIFLSLTRSSSMSLSLAWGLTLFRIISSMSLMLTGWMFSWVSLLSMRTRVRSSLMILFSLSISLSISCRNSL